MEACHRRPLVVSQALHLDSLDVEVVSTTLVRAPKSISLIVTKLAHPQASPAPLVASQELVSLVPQVVSSLPASLVLLAANLLLASTLLRDDNHDNTPEKHTCYRGLDRSEKSRNFDGRSSGLTKLKVGIRPLSVP